MARKDGRRNKGKAHVCGLGLHSWGTLFPLFSQFATATLACTLAASVPEWPASECHAASSASLVSHAEERVAELVRVDEPVMPSRRVVWQAVAPLAARGPHRVLVVELQLRQLVARVRIAQVHKPNPAVRDRIDLSWKRFREEAGRTN